MHTERKTLSGDGDDRWLEAVEVLAQGGPAIDDQEHIAVRIVRNGCITDGTQLAEYGHRIDAKTTEASFPRAA